MIACNAAIAHSACKAIAKLTRQHAARHSASPGRSAAYAVDASSVDRGTLRGQRRELHRTSAAEPKPVVLDCQADWCGPCKTLAPILEAEIAKTQGKVLLATLDVDAEQELSGRLGVQQLPTVMGFCGGTVPKDGAGNPLVLLVPCRSRRWPNLLRC